ncbi:MAG TPA: tail fiber protein [Bryobacteraceae bacterium]|jgi:microcystin-dependent protein
MSSPYVGECRLVGFNFAPVGWAMCNGQQLAISQNDTLFNLIGTTYGGNGQQTFDLPNLQGRVPIHQGSNGTTFVIGQSGGSEQVTLTTQQMASHNHAIMASISNGTSGNVQNNTLAGSSGGQVYIFTNPVLDTPMKPQAIGLAGGNQPHDNLQPFLVLNWIISLFGIYPTQS